jgi:hypothetical protein
VNGHAYRFGFLVNERMRTIWSWAARVLCALVSVTLVSCGGLRTTYLADGTKGYAVSCRGFLNTWDACLVKAGRMCGAQGYDIIESDKYGRTLLVGCKVPGRSSLSSTK